MNRPRLFISAVSTELKTVRQAVANTTYGLGYDPVWQDVFHTASGKLLQMLRDKVDSCEGLLQIAGVAYGAEPPTDTEFGRVSYTQYEFLYAQQQGKKTWLIKAGEHCQRDKPIEQLDLPAEALKHPDPTAYQAERRLLQQDYLLKLNKENHLHHPAENDLLLENTVLKLRDELAELRKKWETWQRDTTAKLDQIAENTRLTTAKIRAHLLETITETLNNALAQAEQHSDWRERERLRQAAESEHQRRLAQVEELAASFAEIEGKGQASSVFTEMTRILAEQGVDEAIAYIASQRGNILQAVKARTANVHERNRADLQPLLQTAALYQNKGQAQPARELYADVFKLEPDWPAALGQYFVFLINQGDDAIVHATLADALREYNAAKSVAERLVVLEPENTEWQRDLGISYSWIGDVLVSQGKLGEAATAYRAYLASAKTLAASDPSNSEWQRDLSVSYEKLGDVAVAQGQLGEAAQAFRDSLAIAKTLAASDPSNSQWKYDLGISNERLGDVFVGQGKLNEAFQVYLAKNEIISKLAASDPSNSGWQRDLSVSYEKLGDVAVAQGQLGEAEQAYRDGLAIAKTLAASDPSNSGWQRDLSVSYEKLGNVAVAQGQLGEASQAYRDGLAIAKTLAASDSSNSGWQRDLYVSYIKLGDVAVAQGQLGEAAQAFRDSLAIAKTLAASDPNNSGWQRDLSYSFYQLSKLQAQQKLWTDALVNAEASLKIDQRLSQFDLSNVTWQKDVKESREWLAQLRQQMAENKH